MPKGKKQVNKIKPGQRKRPGNPGQGNQKRPQAKMRQKKGSVKVRGKGTPKLPSIYEPNRPLTKDALRNAVKQAVNMQLNPTLRMQTNASNELIKQRELDFRNIGRQGAQATGNIGAYYQDLAAKEAARLAAQSTTGAATTGAVAQAGVDTQGAIAAAGDAAQTGIGAYEGQSIAARDRLAAMIAEQQAGAAQNSNALNTQAQGQAAGFQNFLSGLGAAAGMRGGEQMADIGRQVQNRFTDTRNEYGQELGKIRADKLELIMQRPELASRALMELRDKEQTNFLSRQALGLKKQEAKQAGKQDRSSIEYAKVNARELIKLKNVEHQQRLEELAAAGASNAELAGIKAQHSKEIIALQQKGYGKSGGGDSSQSGGWQPFSKTFSYLRGSPVKPKTLATSKKARKAAYDKLRTYGASDKVARKAIKKYIGQHNRKYIKAARDPNGKSLGR
jgi:hypothetical protein